MVAYIFIFLGGIGSLYVGFSLYNDSRAQITRINSLPLIPDGADSLPGWILIDTDSSSLDTNGNHRRVPHFVIPLIDLETRAPELAAYRDQRVVIRGTTGTHARIAAKILRKAGFRVSYLEPKEIGS